MIFTLNKSLNPHNTRGGKLLLKAQVKSSHYDAKSLRYDGPVTWNNFSRNINDNNVYNLGISKFKNFLEIYLRVDTNDDWK